MTSRRISLYFQVGTSTFARLMEPGDCIFLELMHSPIKKNNWDEDI